MKKRIAIFVALLLLTHLFSCDNDSNKLVDPNTEKSDALSTIENSPDSNAILIPPLKLSISIKNSGQVQPPWNLSIGTVNNGLGNSPGAGYYNVEITIYTHKRFNRYANDDGETDPFCSVADQPQSNCPGPFLVMDGVRLRPGSARRGNGLGVKPKWIHFTSGSAPDIGRILGPFQKLGSSPKLGWEWPAEGTLVAGGQRFYTNRQTPLFEARYENIYWSGNKAQVWDVWELQWFESDPILTGYEQSDFSDWGHFNLGDMIQKCLQSGGTPGQQVTLLAKNNDFYWNLCSENGCFDHYNIEVYYNVVGKWWKVGYLAPPTISGSISNNHPKISWNSVANATGYKIYQRFNTSSGSYFQIATTSSTNYVDTTQEIYSGNGTKQYVYYKVKAYNSNGDSDFSNYRQFTVENQLY